MGPPNEGHFIFGDDMNSADVFFVERLSSFRDSICIEPILFGPKVVSFVERFIILCRYWESPLSEVSLYSVCTLHRFMCM